MWREPTEILQRSQADVVPLVYIALEPNPRSAICISKTTVKADRGRVMQKMNTACFAELINMAATLLPANWVTDPPELQAAGNTAVLHGAVSESPYRSVNDLRTPHVVGNSPSY
jgi:hypothetical protein